MVLQRNANLRGLLEDLSGLVYSTLLQYNFTVPINLWVTRQRLRWKEVVKLR